MLEVSEESEQAWGLWESKEPIFCFHPQLRRWVKVRCRAWGELGKGGQVPIPYLGFWGQSRQLDMVQVELRPLA